MQIVDVLLDTLVQLPDDPEYTPVYSELTL